MPKSGIYQIVNVRNGKCYVGSAQNIKGRWTDHLSYLRRQIHTSKLRRAWDKYGEDNFQFLVLEHCSLSDLTVREQYWIDALDSFKTGYNSRPRAENNLGAPGPNKGKKFSAEARSKMSASHKGHPGFWTGKSRGSPLPETRKKLSVALMGRSPTMVGKTHSVETRKKMSEARKRYLASQE